MNIPLFKHLTNQEIDELLLITHERRYKKRMVIFMEGEQREAVYFIKYGSVKAYKIDEEGNKQVISLLKEGDMFPHVGFFDQSPYPATAEVVSDTELLVIRIKDFEQLLLKRPQMSIKVMTVMGQKIIDLQNRIQDFISKDVQQRFIQVIIKMASEHGKKHEKGIYLEVPLTNQDFANMVGTTRETVNRMLTQLRKRKVIHLERDGILIYNINDLS